MNEKVLEFIENFQNDGTIKTFTQGCCYWFACILAMRFSLEDPVPDICIMYHQVLGHFACSIDNKIYDVQGEINDREGWMPWSDWLKNEPVYGKTVINDCILKSTDHIKNI
jgi:hypothetical protein